MTAIEKIVKGLLDEINPPCLSCRWYQPDEAKTSPCDKCRHGSESKADYYLPKSGIK